MPSDLDALLGDEGEETVDGIIASTPDQNAVFERVRNYSRRVERDKKKLTKELADRETRIAEFVKRESETQAKAAAKQFGLKDEQVQTILTLKPDATPEQIGLLAQSFGMKADAATTEETPTTGAAPGTAASPLTAPEPLSGAQLPSQGIYFDEFLAMAQNPNTHLQAVKMWEKGLVRNENKPRQ